jgi:hypothetical protein
MEQTDRPRIGIGRGFHSPTRQALLNKDLSDNAVAAEERAEVAHECYCPHTSVIGSKFTAAKHQLRILSLRNLVAECSCGSWRVTLDATPLEREEDLRERARILHDRHVRDAEQGKRKKD